MKKVDFDDLLDAFYNELVQECVGCPRYLAHRLLRLVEDKEYLNETKGGDK